MDLYKPGQSEMEYPPAQHATASGSVHHGHGPGHGQPRPSRRRQFAQRTVAFAMTALVGMSKLNIILEWSRMRRG